MLGVMVNQDISWHNQEKKGLVQQLRIRIGMVNGLNKSPWTKKVLGLKKILDPERFLVRKIFWSREKILVQKNF